MKDTKEKVLVIPCSGIGKVQGLIAREVALQVADERLPEHTKTLCLALLVKGDEEAVAAIKASRCITIDGCQKLCSNKNVELAGGTILRSIKVADAFKDHKGAQPGTATKLEADGWQIVNDLAETGAGEVMAACEGKEQ